MNINKYLVSISLSVSLLGVISYYASAQQGPVLTGALDNQTPLAKSIQASAKNVDIARITLTVSGGDVYLNGIQLATDISGGLSNLTDIKIYDLYSSSSGPVLLGVAPNQSANPYLVKFGNTIIGNGGYKTYLVRASLSDSAAGSIRLGFSGFSYPTQAVPSLSGIPVLSNVMTLPGATPPPAGGSTPTPTPLATPKPPAEAGTPIPTSHGFTSLAAMGLHEGDTISVAGSSDPDIYIANDWGYKRLFLNPVIFSFYGHLGGFAKVKNILSSTRDTLVTSDLFRNCETPIPSSLGGATRQANDPSKVYALEVTGEDTGILHWVNTSGAQAVQDDPDFFKKVFCINSNEFNWYSKGADYTSVNQAPLYSR